MGGFFEDLHEGVRDHARDEFYQSLQALGLPAGMALRDALEESILGGNSLGLVTIPRPHGLIRWVNVRKEAAIDVEIDLYFTDYAVPDSRLLHLSTSLLDIKCDATGGFWPFRKPTGVRWQGYDLDLGWFTGCRRIPLSASRCWDAAFRRER